MNLPELSIKRPVLVTCVFFVILILGYLSQKKLNVALFPDVSYPIVNVVVPYPGAGPQEIESQVSKPIETAFSSLAGIRILRSTNLDGAGIVTAVFGMNEDIRFAEQKIIQTVAAIRSQLPKEILEPIIRSVDPTDTPVLVLSLTANLPEGKLFDLADQEIRPALEQVAQVGLVTLEGARKREIHVDLDESKLKAREMSATEVVGRLGAGGRNTPAGLVEDKDKQRLVRVLGEYRSLDVIRNTIIRFVGDESPILLNEIATVSDSLEEEKNRVYINGKRALTLKVYRQSGGNTVALADLVKERLSEMNAAYKKRMPTFDLQAVHDSSVPVRESVADATESILYGVALTVLVVLIFLGSVRSTLITGIALPNSLIGAFLLMWLAGFTINITTLAALSLAVGLLVDDAIVVRENIFRRIELGESPWVAAVLGTREVTLAVVATTLTVLSVFGPIAFLQGLIGQFFKQFGLTICFAMLISLLDSLTMAPMLSAYFAGRAHDKNPTGPFRGFKRAFDRFQLALENGYLRLLKATLRRPLVVLAVATAIFVGSFFVLNRIPKAFLPPAGAGEFRVVMDTAPSTSLEGMDSLARAVEEKLRQHAEVSRTLLTTGGENGEAYQATIFVTLKAQRALRTDEMKDLAREDLKAFPALNARVEDILDIGGGAGQPYTLNLSAENLADLKTVSTQLMAELKKTGDLKDVDSTFRVGAPELRVTLNPKRSAELGVLSASVGQEMRILIAGYAPARFHEESREYDIRVRLRPEQRDLRQSFKNIFISNINHRQIPLSAISELQEVEGLSAIYRENRRRFIQVTADTDPKGRGLAQALTHTRELFESGAVPLPPGVRYEFAGQTKDFQELLASIVLVLGLSVGAMYIVLACLYESFFIPFSIMLVLPLAVCGAFYALWLTHLPIDIYSMVGCILLLGVAAKNSILLVDYINEGLRAGKDLTTAILEAGRIRLRPILMTSFALIAGMLPVAIPHQESGQQRASMAIAVIGGLISSTLLSLAVVPAAYGYINRFQDWFTGLFRGILSKPD